MSAINNNYNPPQHDVQGSQASLSLTQPALLPSFARHEEVFQSFLQGRVTELNEEIRIAKWAAQNEPLQTLNSMGDKYSFLSIPAQISIIATALFQNQTHSLEDKRFSLITCPYLNNTLNIQKKTDEIIAYIDSGISQSLSETEKVLINKYSPKDQGSISKWAIWFSCTRFLTEAALYSDSLGFYGINHYFPFYFPLFEKIISIVSPNDFYRFALSDVVAENLYFHKEKINKLLLESQSNSQKNALLPRVLLCSFVDRIEELAFLKPLGKELADSTKTTVLVYLLLNFYLNFNATDIEKRKIVNLLAKTDDLQKFIYNLQNLYNLSKLRYIQPFLKQVTNDNFNKTLSHFLGIGLSNYLKLHIPIEAYEKTIAKSRFPGALLTYVLAFYASYPADDLSLLILRGFVSDILQGTSQTTRYQTRYLHKILSKEQKLAWQTRIEKTLDQSYTIEDSDQWDDLLLSGTEIQGSCLNIHIPTLFAEALLPYLVDGKNRMALIKNSSGKIVARRVLRLVSHGKNPVLFQERTYVNPGVPQEALALLDQLCIEKAKSLKIDLVRSVNFEKGESGDYPSDLFISKSPAYFEYIDALKAPRTPIGGLENSGAVIPKTAIKKIS